MEPESHPGYRLLGMVVAAVDRGIFAREYVAKHGRFLEPSRGTPRFEEIVGRRGAGRARFAGS
jgi:hypothetical protein